MIIVDLICMTQPTLILGSEFYESHVFQKCKTFCLAQDFNQKKNEWLVLNYWTILNNLALAGWLHKWTR